MGLCIKGEEADRIARDLAAEFCNLPVLVHRAADAILGYDADGITG